MPDNQSPWGSALDDNLGFLLWQVTMLRQKQINQLLKPIELTHAQLVLLSALKRLASEQEQALTQIQLAEYTRTDVAMTSQILGALEQRGLLRRWAHPSDGRAKHVALTPAGEDLVREAIPLVRASDGAFFDLSQAEHDQLRGLLQKLYRQQK